MWKPEIKKAYVVGTDVKFRQHAGKEYPAIGSFEPMGFFYALIAVSVEKK